MRKRFKKIVLYSTLVFMLIIFLFGSVFFIANKLYPLPLEEIDTATVVVDRNGKILRNFANKEGVFRHWITTSELHPDYIKMLLNFEDRYFYQHFGINPVATLRAFIQWTTHRRVISGGSTLTMQVARLIDPHERTISGKIKQAFRALQLEYYYSKEEILTFYINLAPMGGNIEGVAAASERYFSKNAHELNFAENALLVALPQRPSVYRPDLFPTNAINARNKVLKRLVTSKVISKARATQIMKDQLGFNPQKTRFHAPLISEQLKQQYPKQAVIKTTLDYPLQITIETMLKQKAPTLPPSVSAAVLVVNNQTHEIHAYVGSTNIFDATRFGYVDMVKAIRSPGSTLKPFIYGLAVDYGIVHEASLLTDVSRNFHDYAPKNFDHIFRGAVTLREALQLSLNVPVVQVLYHLTPHHFIKALRKANIEILVNDPSLSVALGGVGISLYEQVKLFSSLGNQGMVSPLSIVFDKDKKPKEKSKRILSSKANWLIVNILSEIKPASRHSSRKIAWKTGTSYGYRDAWAIGTSPDWTIGVWLGRPDGVPNIGALANTFATPLLFDLFNLLPKDQSSIEKPWDITRETICWPSGRKVTDVIPEQCKKQYIIHSLGGKVPPTLYDSRGENNHGSWPIALNKTLENPSSTIKILNLANKSIIFKANQIMELQATGRAPLRWYLNNQLMPGNLLNIGALLIGKSHISVIDSDNKGDSIEIEVRDIY